MLKLYRRTPSQILYWETWDNDDGSHTVHWGSLGAKGESKTVRSTGLRKVETKVQAEIDRFVSDGYQPIELDDHRILLIEYTVDGFGDAADLKKRYRLQDRMDQTLGWTGLGMCDGGSIGSDTMEVCCYVVDYDVAEQVVATDLKGTEFGNYSRIYDEGAEDA